MKKFRQNVALALAYIAAAPFLLVGFIIWLFTPEKSCIGCDKARYMANNNLDPDEIENIERTYCEKCKNNPDGMNKKNRKCP